MKQTCVVLITFSMLFFVGTAWAALITPLNSGYWSSTATNEPWPNGILPTTNDFVEVTTGITITNDTTNAVCEALDSSEDTGAATGTVLMEPNSVLTVCGQNEGYGAYDLDVLDATATNCTVIYQGNSFWAKHTDYWNLVFSGWGDFYNGSIYGNPSTPMTIYGNFIMDGTNVPSDQTTGYTGCYVECGDDITVDGNLYIGPSNAWDCSVGNITVYGNTICAGMLWDKDAMDGSNNFVGGLTIVSNGMWLTNVQNTLVAKLGWTNADNVGPNDVYGPGNAGVRGGSLYIMDVQEWAVGGNLTNDGIIGFGTNYGSITMYGNGVMAGTNPMYMPTLFINGTNEVLDTVNLTTNYPAVNGTLIFDLAYTNEITLDAGTNAFYYSANGTLEVVDSGRAPVAGQTFQLFDNLANTNYVGQYATTTLPALPSGLTWTNELLVDGSIAVLGGASINITSGHYNAKTLQFQLTWSSTVGADYTVLESPTLNPPNWTPLQSNIPSGGTTTTVTVTMPAGTKGFLQVMSQ